MKHRLLALIAVVTLLTAPAFADQKIKVGISGGDSEIVWGKVKEIAAKDGLDVQVVVFSDYLLPNAALDAGDLDANAFQHKPFLDNQIKTRGYKITPVGETIVAPIGLYSKKVKSVSEIEDGSSIGIPNDPSNGGRALLIIVLSGLVGGIIWNLFTWLLGMPSSSSHALFGGLIGAAFAAMGSTGVEWSSIAGKIIIPAVASPIKIGRAHV